MKPATCSYRTALSLMSSLVDAGVRCLVASPGFRNSPLLLAARREKGLDVLTAVDERGAAFLALGLSRAGQPAALLCTSGTAVANYFPAVMEAYESHCPLVVLTADRPHELIGTGANQCTDQAKVFGTHVRFFAELSSDETAEAHIAYSAAKAVNLARHPVAGPVHLNIRFREPFLPEAAEVEGIEKGWEKPSGQWTMLASASGPSQEQWLAVETLFRVARRPLFVVGPNNFPADLLESLQSLSAHTGYPILAENASGLPFRGGNSGHIGRHLESTLGAMAEAKIGAPDLLVRIGAPLTGRALGQLLKASQMPQILFDQIGESREPHLHPSICIQGGLEGWVLAFLRSDLSLADQQWRSSLLEFGARREEQLGSHLAKGALTEWKFHHGLGEKIADGSAIFLGNSMPIRDFNDAFSSKKLLHVFTNRGLSGIDGLIATACGVAIGAKRETHAILGDLSALHDISSLSLLSSLRERLNFTLWTINNDGGEIFRIVGTSKTAGEPNWFTTPQTYDAAALAKAFQIPFARISSVEDWEALDASACTGPGVRWIEIQVDRETNLATRRSFRSE
jgi:2-succinyl-5-enolpyruvyl-6-hydroxy-3-cyclohexene-1-carboxylate synthase